MCSARKAVQGKVKEMPQKPGTLAPQPGMTLSPEGRHVGQVLTIGAGARPRAGADPKVSTMEAETDAWH